MMLGEDAFFIETVQEFIKKNKMKTEIKEVKIYI